MTDESRRAPFPIPDPIRTPGAHLVASSLGVSCLELRYRHPGFDATAQIARLITLSARRLDRAAADLQHALTRASTDLAHLAKLSPTHPLRLVGGLTGDLERLEGQVRHHREALSELIAAYTEATGIPVL